MTMNKILLIDDDVSHLKLLRILLENKGFDVKTTPRAINVLEILEKTKFDLIVTDFNMPDMNGIKLAMKVRGKYPDARIIMVTGDFSPDIAETAANAGISHIFSKPVKITKLLATIRSSLKQSCVS
jgi:two-component system, CitB family, response regulator DctR